MDYADKKDIDRLDNDVEKTNQKMTKFVLKTDVSEKFKKVERDIWEELSLKLEKKTFERKFDHFEQEQLNAEKQTKKEIASLREVIDRMRRKSEETTLSINELRQESDSKLSAKEGQKLWANFRKYAQYDELRELYRKTMPAISGFEDKLKENNDHNERVDMMCRRLDEIICSKADRASLKEFKEYCAEYYISRTDNEKTSTMIDVRISDFSARCDEVENMVKF